MNDELNKRIAELLGWTQLEWADDDVDEWGMSIVEVKNWHGVNPQTGKRAFIPRFCGDLNAIVAVLAQHDITLRLGFGPVLSARISPESYVGEPEVPEFSAHSAEHWQLVGEHAGIAGLAALAFADWLTWLREQGGTP